MRIIRYSFILILFITNRSYAFDVCDEGDVPWGDQVFQGSLACDPKELFNKDMLTSKEEKSAKLCECLNKSYQIKKEVFKAKPGVEPPSFDFEKKYGDKKEFIDRELSRGLRQSLRNLISISQNFSDFTRTKTDIANLIPTKADGTPDESRACNLMAFDKELKEKYLQMAGYPGCPASAKEINRRYKEIFQTDIDKESRLYTYYTEFRDEFKDKNGERSCMDRRDYISLKGLGESAREASKLLLSVPDFESLRNDITEKSKNIKNDSLAKSI